MAGSILSSCQFILLIVRNKQSWNLDVLVCNPTWTISMSSTSSGHWWRSHPFVLSLVPNVYEVFNYASPFPKHCPCSWSTWEKSSGWTGILDSYKAASASTYPHIPLLYSYPHLVSLHPQHWLILIILWSPNTRWMSPLQDLIHAAEQPHLCYPISRLPVSGLPWPVWAQYVGGGKQNKQRASKSCSCPLVV